MKQENPLFYLFKKLSWPVGLIIIAVLISSLGSITGLLVPFFTGKLVDKFSFENMNWMFVAGFISIFIVSTLLCVIGLYLVL
ncbi:ABC transporter ATP-binding protein, partial [Staphylococcus saprophyticus]